MSFLSQKPSEKFLLGKMCQMRLELMLFSSISFSGDFESEIVIVTLSDLCVISSCLALIEVLTQQCCLKKR